MSDVWRMSTEDAEEYTCALGQIMSGGWRQIALAQRLGVPDALGMTTEEWVQERIGGYVRLGLDERRQAAQALTDPEGEFRLTQRQAAEVLGIAQKTVSRDVQPESDDSSGATVLGEENNENESHDSPRELSESATEIDLDDIDLERPDSSEVESDVARLGDVRAEISAAFDDEAIAAEMAAARHTDEMTRVRATWIRFVAEHPPGVFADGLDRPELGRLVSDIERISGWLEQARSAAASALRPRKVV